MGAIRTRQLQDHCLKSINAALHLQIMVFLAVVVFSKKYHIAFGKFRQYVFFSC